VVALDDVEVLATWDARNEKFVGINFVTVPDDAGPVIAALELSAERRLVAPKREGIYTLNCAVDASGKIDCPETVWAPGLGAHQPPDPSSFHRLKFSGKITTQCFLMTSKNLDAAGKPPPEGTVGVAIGAKLDLGL
jgi:hypothetical protein